MKSVVKELERVTPRVFILRLETEKPVEFRPGQFIQVILDKDGKAVRKAYSIVSCSGSCIELCIRIVDGGFASNYLAGLKSGQSLELEGPFGNFVLQDELSNGMVFVATGVGIAGVKPLIEDAFNRRVSHGVWLIFGVRTEADVLYKKEFDVIAASNENFHFVPVLSRSDNPDYEHGYVQDAFRKLIKPESQDVYICGISKMVDEVKAICRELGFPDRRVHFEKYV